jgi:hypothetical protein
MLTKVNIWIQLPAVLQWPIAGERANDPIEVLSPFYFCFSTPLPRSCGSTPTSPPLLLLRTELPRSHQGSSESQSVVLEIQCPAAGGSEQHIYPAKHMSGLTMQLHTGGVPWSVDEREYLDRYNKQACSFTNTHDHNRVPLCMKHFWPPINFSFAKAASIHTQSACLDCYPSHKHCGGPVGGCTCLWRAFR